MSIASLTVVGAGIKAMAHITAEAKANIEQADKVLYLLNEPLMKTWLHTLNDNTESLDELYTKYSSREQSYAAITQYILSEVKRSQRVCVVIYGHPTVLATPALNAVTLAQQENIPATILPGISAEDCLFADLHINPGSHGCLSLEATDLLVHRRHIDVTCHVILWQVSVIGLLEHAAEYDNRKGLQLLHAYLSQFYAVEQPLVSYSAAQYPGFPPVTQQFSLQALPDINFARTATLYIPPAKKMVCDEAMLVALGISHVDVVS